MAERSGFFPYVSGDSNSEYDSAFLARWVASFISNGTYDGELAVTADTNMQVKLPAGRAWINGYYYCNDGNLALAIANADGVLNRKDTVVLRWNINTRNITVQVLKGTPASTATAPVITRTAEQYDLKLAEISIPAGTTAITQSLITDTRLDNSVCGIVHAVVDHLDTSTFYNQIQNDLANFKSGSETDFNTWKNKFQSDLVNWKSTSESDYSTWSTEQKTAFDAWLQSIKDVLDADTAGHLQTEIDGKAEKTHASTHAAGGSDPLKPGDIGAYTKEETVNNDTRKLLELNNTATPNDIFQKIILGTGKYAFGVTVKLSNGDAGGGLTLGGLTTFAGASPVTDSNGYALCVSTSKTPTLTISSPYADLKNVSQKLTADVGKVVTPVTITVGIINSKTLEVTSSSTIKFAFAHKADLFAVGGGAGGAWGGSSSYDNYGGGGGGYTKTLLAQNIAAGIPIAVAIGAGGSSGCSGGTTTIAVNGTTVVSAGGGRTGGCATWTQTATGGSGGSAGGGARQHEDHNDNDYYYVGNGGTDGGTASYASGTSQGSTTRAFGESTGTLYAGGGGGYCGGHVSGTGGAGGGGSSNHDATYYGGGGGAGSTAVRGGHGYQGIALVRWKA